MEQLILVDVDRIQDYVFESSKLPEIRGGSILVERILSERIPELIKSKYSNFEIVFSSGGAALMHGESDKSQVSRLSREIGKLFLEETLACSASIVFETVSSLENTNQFQQAMNRLAFRMRRKKDAHPFKADPGCEPVLQRCASCGKRPATGFISIGGDDRWLCQVCRKKLSVGGQSGRSYFLDLFNKWREKKEDKGHLKMPADLEDIAKCVTNREANDTVALVYLDANDAGQFIQSLGSMQDYRSFSESVIYAARESTLRALAGIISGKNESAPFEILTIGGDDILVFVPGDCGLQVARDICDGFDALFKEHWKRGADHLTMCAGVAIAHHKTPVKLMKSVATSLLKEAKSARARECARQQTKLGAYIDYWIMSGDFATLRSVSEERESQFRSRRDPKYSLTRKPYSAKALAKLIEKSIELRKAGYPVNRLYAIRDALRDGYPKNAVIQLKYQEARSKRKSIEFPDNVVWNGTDTGLIDFMEVYRYVK